MFGTFTVKQLKKLISDFKKYHTIKNYSKMRKQQLVAELDNRFEIRNAQLFLKNAPAVEPKAKKTKTVAPAIVPQDAPQRQDGLTDGQRTLKNKINAIEQQAIARENYVKDSAFAKRLRGNK
jgi:chaperonin cofactor prefoldin